LKTTGSSRREEEKAEERQAASEPKLSFRVQTGCMIVLFFFPFFL
jgi:hypothetical protein